MSVARLQDFRNQRGHWDPDRWHQNRRRGSTPPPGAEEAREKPTRGLAAATGDIKVKNLRWNIKKKNGDRLVRRGIGCALR